MRNHWPPPARYRSCELFEIADLVLYARDEIAFDVVTKRQHIAAVGFEQALTPRPPVNRRFYFWVLDIVDEDPFAEQQRAAGVSSGESSLRRTTMRRTFSAFKRPPRTPLREFSSTLKRLFPWLALTYGQSQQWQNRRLGRLRASRTNW